MSAYRLPTWGDLDRRVQRRSMSTAWKHYSKGVGRAQLLLRQWAGLSEADDRRLIIARLRRLGELLEGQRAMFDALGFEFAAPESEQAVSDLIDLYRQHKKVKRR